MDRKNFFNTIGFYNESSSLDTKSNKLPYINKSMKVKIVNLSRKYWTLVKFMIMKKVLFLD
jgi:hypothetical protein